VTFSCSGSVSAGCDDRGTEAVVGTYKDGVPQQTAG